MFNSVRILSILAVSISALTVLLPTKAEEVCQVTDPTGTPLNVRSEPNGLVINTLKMVEKFIFLR